MSSEAKFPHRMLAVHGGEGRLCVSAFERGHRCSGAWIRTKQDRQMLRYTGRLIEFGMPRSRLSSKQKSWLDTIRSDPEWKTMATNVVGDEKRARTCGQHQCRAIVAEMARRPRTIRLCHVARVCVSFRDVLVATLLVQQRLNRVHVACDVMFTGHDTFQLWIKSPFLWTRTDNDGVGDAYSAVFAWFMVLDVWKWAGPFVRDDPLEEPLGETRMDPRTPHTKTGWHPTLVTSARVVVNDGLDAALRGRNAAWFRWERETQPDWDDVPASLAGALSSMLWDKSVLSLTDEEVRKARNRMRFTYTKAVPARVKPRLIETIRRVWPSLWKVDTSSVQSCYQEAHLGTQVRCDGYDVYTVAWAHHVQHRPCVLAALVDDESDDESEDDQCHPSFRVGWNPLRKRVEWVHLVCPRAACRAVSRGRVLYACSRLNHIEELRQEMPKLVNEPESNVTFREVHRDGGRYVIRRGPQEGADLEEVVLVQMLRRHLHSGTPGPFVTIVFCGPQGCGKSTMAALGLDAISRPDPADEAMWQGRVLPPPLMNRKQRAFHVPALAVTMRRALAAALGTTLNDVEFVSYTDLKREGAHDPVHETPRLALQLDSLGRLLVEGSTPATFRFCRKFRVLILDECESLLAYYEASTLGRKRDLVIEILECIMRQVDFVWILDADMRFRWSVHFARTMRPHVPLHVFLFDPPPPPVPRRVFVSSNMGNGGFNQVWYQCLVDTLRSNQSCALHTNVGIRSTALPLQQALIRDAELDAEDDDDDDDEGSEARPKGAFFLHGKEPRKEEMASNTKLWSQYRLFHYNSAAGVGVDHNDPDGPKQVFCFARNNTSPPREVVQGCGRVRRAQVIRATLPPIQRPDVSEAAMAAESEEAKLSQAILDLARGRQDCPTLSGLKFVCEDGEMKVAMTLRNWLAVERAKERQVARNYFTTDFMARYLAMKCEVYLAPYVQVDAEEMGGDGGRQDRKTARETRLAALAYVSRKQIRAQDKAAKAGDSVAPTPVSDDDISVNGKDGDPCEVLSSSVESGALDVPCEMESSLPPSVENRAHPDLETRPPDVVAEVPYELESDEESDSVVQLRLEPEESPSDEPMCSPEDLKDAKEVRDAIDECLGLEDLQPVIDATVGKFFESPYHRREYMDYLWLLLDNQTCWSWYRTQGYRELDMNHADNCARMMRVGRVVYARELLESMSFPDVLSRKRMAESTVVSKHSIPYDRLCVIRDAFQLPRPDTKPTRMKAWRMDTTRAVLRHFGITLRKESRAGGTTIMLEHRREFLEFAWLNLTHPPHRWRVTAHDYANVDDPHPLRLQSDDFKAARASLAERLCTYCARLTFKFGAMHGWQTIREPYQGVAECGGGEDEEKEENNGGIVEMDDVESSDDSVDEYFRAFLAHAQEESSVARSEGASEATSSVFSGCVSLVSSDDEASVAEDASVASQDTVGSTVVRCDIVRDVPPPSASRPAKRQRVDMEEDEEKSYRREEDRFFPGHLGSPVSSESSLFD